MGFFRFSSADHSVFAKNICANRDDYTHSSERMGRPLLPLCTLQRERVCVYPSMSTTNIGISAIELLLLHV